jgi:excisionase family DNA binding protein
VTFDVMNATTVSQLELRGMAAGDDACAETPTPARRDGGGKRTHVDSRGARSGATGTGLRANASEKLRLARNVVGAGAVETLLNFAEAARALGISLRQFRRLVDSGRVAFVKVSERAPRIRPSELQRFLDASAVKYSEIKS